MKALLLSLLLAAPAVFAAPKKTVDQFNIDFVDALLAKKTPQWIEKKNLDGFAEMSLRVKNNPAYKPIAAAGYVCMAPKGVAFCFEPVKDGKKIGFRFNGGKRVFYPTAKNRRDYREQFQSFIRGDKKTASLWQAFVGENAQAAEAEDYLSWVATDVSQAYHWAFGDGDEFDFLSDENPSRWKSLLEKNSRYSCANPTFVSDQGQYKISEIKGTDHLKITNTATSEQFIIDYAYYNAFGTKCGKEYNSTATPDGYWALNAVASDAACFMTGGEYLRTSKKGNTMCQRTIGCTADALMMYADFLKCTNADCSETTEATLTELKFLDPNDTGLQQMQSEIAVAEANYKIIQKRLFSHSKSESFGSLLSEADSAKLRLDKAIAQHNSSKSLGSEANLNKVMAEPLREILAKGVMLKGLSNCCAKEECRTKIKAKKGVSLMDDSSTPGAQ